jgi:hypothetical protein
MVPATVKQEHCKSAFLVTSHLHPQRLLQDPPNTSRRIHGSTFLYVPNDPSRPPARHIPGGKERGTHLMAPGGYKTHTNTQASYIPAGTRHKPSVLKCFVHNVFLGAGHPTVIAGNYITLRIIPSREAFRRTNLDIALEFT